MGRVREEKRREEEKRSKRESLRRKKIQAREKVGKYRNTVFFQWLVVPEGRKVGSLKRRVRSQLARWEMKNCTPLWRGAHFEVKMYKTHHVRTTSGSCDVEKVHAVVARSTFRSQKVQNTTCLDHFWRLDVVSRGRRKGLCTLSNFGASDLQFWEDDFAWQVQHFLWLGLTFSWQAQYFRQVKWKNRKTHWYEAASSTLNFPFLKEASQNCFVFDVVNFEKWGSLAELFCFWYCCVFKAYN